MTVIKNVHKLDLSEVKRGELEKLASFHKRYSNIEFKILSVDDNGLVVAVKQGKHLSENYADKKRLISLTKELFASFFSGKIHVHAMIFEPHTISEITPEWIQKKMEKQNIRVIDIVQDTDIDKTNISAWVRGIRPMSKIVKSMFYYYIESKEKGGKSIQKVR